MRARVAIVTASTLLAVLSSSSAAVAQTPPGAFVWDTFTDSNSVSLTSHTPNVKPTGATWANLEGNTPTVQGNLITEGSSSGWVLDTIDAGVGNGKVAADVVRQTSQPWGGLVFRATDANNLFILKYRTGIVGLHKRVGGTVTDVTQSTVSQAATSSRHRLSVELVGSSIKVYWDAVLQFEVTDTFNQTATKHGLVWYPAIDNATYLDDFEVSALNGTPVITGPDNQTYVAGAAVSVPITATDPESTTITYGATGLPAGLSVNISSGVISGTLAAAPGTYSSSVTASDGVTTGNRSVTWTIVGPGSIVRDSFTDTNGVSLTAHTPNVAPNGWVLLEGTVPKIQGNLATETLSTAWAITTIDSGAANASVSVDVARATSEPWGGLILRATDANNFLLVKYRYGVVGLHKRQGGTLTDIRSENVTSAAQNTRHRLRVELQGSIVRVFWDGALSFQETVTFQQTATRHGLAWYPTIDNGTFLDDFDVSAVNGMPVISGPGNQTYIAGAPVVVSVAALDPEGTSLTFGSTGLPAGLGINPTTGVISGALTASVGSYTSTVTAFDGANTASRAIRWTVVGVGTLVKDEFTDTNNTSLTAHVPNISQGSGWAALEGTTPKVQSDLITENASTAWAISAIESGAANAVVAADVVRQTSQPWGAIVFRVTDANNLFILKYRSGIIGLHKRVAGTVTDLTQSTVTQAATNSRHRLSVDLQGSLMKVYWDGVFQFDWTDSFQQTATKHGLAWYPAIDNATHLDDFEVKLSEGVNPGGCSYSLSANSDSVAVGGGTDTFTVTTGSSCFWSVNVSANWTTVSPLAKTGSGTVTYTVQANAGSASRDVVISIEGQTFRISQSGTGTPTAPPPTAEPGPEPTSPLGEPPAGTPYYYHADAIGSIRLITDDNSLEERHDFQPFGVEWGTPANTAGSRIFFGGKERDSETGATGWQALDYFGARYYQAQIGRFTTVDPVTAASSAALDPQRWNPYAYARNNPLRFTDPDGRCLDGCIAELAVLTLAGGVVSAANYAVTQWASEKLTGVPHPITKTGLGLAFGAGLVAGVGGGIVTNGAQLIAGIRLGLVAQTTVTVAAGAVGNEIMQVGSGNRVQNAASDAASQVLSSKATPAGAGAAAKVGIGTTAGIIVGAGVGTFANVAEAARQPRSTPTPPPRPKLIYPDPYRPE